MVKNTIQKYLHSKYESIINNTVLQESKIKSSHYRQLIDDFAECNALV